MIVDVVYLTHNRREFTEVTLNLLLENTDWDLVSKLFVYDDHSSDGTLDLVGDTLLGYSHLDWEIIMGTARRGPVAVMNQYAALDRDSDVFAKIDNDICVPQGWLEEMLGVLDRNPEIEVLGMEAGMTGYPGRDGEPFDGVYGFEPSSHIGGVGLIRSKALKDIPRIPENGRFGWTEWQSKYQLVRGWITPDLLAPALDRIPTEPWLSLSAEYEQRGWQRPWPKYERPWSDVYWQWINELDEEAA